MATRAEVVSINSLSKSIDKAVSLAARRYDVSFGPENIINKWEILGRILREHGTLSPGGAVDVAAAVAKGAGLKGTPVVTRIGKEILVGVIPLNLERVRF